MNKKGRLTTFSSVFVLALSIYLTIPAFNAVNAATKDSDSFGVLSKELEKAQTYTKQEKDDKGVVKKVSFDTDGAKNAGISQEGVTLGQEMADFTNELVQLGSYMFTIDLNKYPNVKDYFKDATKYEKERSSVNNSDADIQPLAYAGDAAGMAVCGWYTNPKPSSSKAYYFWGPYSDPSAVARSWGYHAPPAGMGYLGWTRPQTWNAWYCGYNTFRDEAVPQSNGKLAEQNYAGWTPRGEPNPEVWASGPWPYSNWPSYVYWWHQTH